MDIETNVSDLFAANGAALEQIFAGLAVAFCAGLLLAILAYIVGYIGGALVRFIRR